MRRKGRVPVTTSDVLVEAVRMYPRLNVVPALERRSQAKVADLPEGDAAVVAEDAEALGVVREAQWQAISDRLRLQRSGHTAYDQAFTPAVSAAVEHGLAEAARHGVHHAGAAHLVVGALLSGPNNATTAFARSRADPAAAIDVIRAVPGYRTDGRPSTVAADMLRLLGAVRPDGSLPARMVSRVFAWYALRGRASPILHAIGWEATRQAVRLGHRSLSTGHLVLAALAIDRDLADARRHLPTGGDNEAARVLRRNGCRLADWHERMPHPDSDPVGSPDVPTMPNYLERPWGPRWRSEAVDAVSTAASLAGGRRRVGTSALLLAALSVRDSVAASVLDGCGASPGAVIAELEALASRR